MLIERMGNTELIETNHTDVIDATCVEGRP